jgi:MFS family permease
MNVIRSCADRVKGCDRDWALRLVSIGFGLLIMAVSGTFYSFSAFSPALKLQLNLTQSEVNLVASTGYIGLNLVAIPAGLIFDRFSHRVMSGISATIYSVGYLLTWAVLMHYIPANAYLLAAIVFVTGAGMCFSYMNPMLTNIHNCPASRRGLVLGLQDGFFGLSAVIFSAIYSVTFGRPADSPLEQNVAGFMLFLAIVVAVVDGLGLVFLRIVPFSTAGASTSAAEKVEVAEAAPTVTEPRDHIGGVRLLKSVNFWLLLALCFLIPGSALMYINNVSFVLQSFAMESHVPLHSILIPISATVSRVRASLLVVVVVVCVSHGAAN